MIERLKMLQAGRGQFPGGRELSESLKKDSRLRNEVEELAGYFLGKSLRGGCSNCFFDAYMQLVALSVADETIKEERGRYELRRGIVLYDTVGKNEMFTLTAANVSEELALYHLKINPGCRKWFDRLPRDIDERLTRYILQGF